jgi:hypothetical protein
MGLADIKYEVRVIDYVPEPSNTGYSFKAVVRFKISTRDMCVGSTPLDNEEFGALGAIQLAKVTKDGLVNTPGKEKVIPAKGSLFNGRVAGVIWDNALTDAAFTVPKYGSIVVDKSTETVYREVTLRWEPADNATGPNVSQPPPGSVGLPDEWIPTYSSNTTIEETPGAPMRFLGVFDATVLDTEDLVSGPPSVHISAENLVDMGSAGGPIHVVKGTHHEPVNAVGLDLDPKRGARTPVITHTIRKIIYTGTTGYVDNGILSGFAGMVNSSDVDIHFPDYNVTVRFLAKRVMIDGITPTPKIFKQTDATGRVVRYPYVELVYRFRENPRGWEVAARNASTHVRAVEGDPDGNGGVLAAGDVPESRRRIYRDPDGNAAITNLGASGNASADTSYVLYAPEQISFNDPLLRLNGNGVVVTIPSS